jgi:hypothetical protein
MHMHLNQQENYSKRSSLKFDHCYLGVSLHKSYFLVIDKHWNLSIWHCLQILKRPYIQLMNMKRFCRVCRVELKAQKYMLCEQCHKETILGDGESLYIEFSRLHY